MIIEALVIAASGAVNRFRGSGLVEGFGKAGAAIMFGLLALLLFWPLWQWAVAAGLCYLFWAIWGWGRWFDLGRLPEDWNRQGEKVSTFDKTINMLSFDNDYIALFIRHAFGMLPAGILLAWQCGFNWLVVIPVFSAAAVACYEIGWRITDKRPIEWAEVLVGLVWGILLVSVFHICEVH
jgi:hypothetical protein